MKPEQENFENLQRLLKLKRYENPPPGYFNDFSANVIAGIKSGSKSRHDNLLEWLFVEAPWMERLFAAFETRPALAWGVGAAICAVIVAAVVFDQGVEFTPQTTVPVVDINTIKPASTEVPSSFDQSQTAQADVNSSNSPTGSLFDQIQPQTQPAGWRP